MGSSSGIVVPVLPPAAGLVVPSETAMPNLIGINLSAGHTGNGNPRRLFLVIEVGDKYPQIIDAIDEGHEGQGRAKRQYPSIRIVNERIETTPAEYREYLRRFTELAKRKAKPSGAKRSSRSKGRRSR